MLHRISLSTFVFQTRQSTCLSWSSNGRLGQYLVITSFAFFYQNLNLPNESSFMFFHHRHFDNVELGIRREWHEHFCCLHLSLLWAEGLHDLYSVQSVCSAVIHMISSTAYSYSSTTKKVYQDLSRLREGAWKYFIYQVSTLHVSVSFASSVHPLYTEAP